MPAFDDLLPPLFRDFDASADSPTKQKVAEAVGLLKSWNRRWAADSIPTSIGVFYGEEIQRAGRGATPEQRLAALAAALDSLTKSFGTWKTPWGEINRFQRISSEIVHPFDDSKPSIPVAFASARYGSLASFGAAPRNGTKKWYGTSGNSFVAVVEFGKDSVRALAVTAGGQSGRVGNKHSTIRPSATRPATYGRCTSIATSSRDTSSGSTGRGSSFYGLAPVTYRAISAVVANHTPGLDFM